jgi:hypothetical protein
MIHLRNPAILLALVLAGCGGSHPADSPRQPIEKDRFIEAYIELRHAAVEVGQAADSVPAFEARKREILERHGISGQDLIDYIEAHSSDLSEMTAVWDTIHRRLGRPDTTASRRGVEIAPEPS